MDAMIAIPARKLFIDPLDTLGAALEAQGCRVAWSKSIASPSGGAPDLVVLSSDHGVADARRNYPRSTVFQVQISGRSGRPILGQRFHKSRPDYQVSLLPQARERRGASIPSLPVRQLDQVPSTGQVWMHAMPKDIPTALVFSDQLPSKKAPPFNLICLSGQAQGLSMSNVYCKEMDDLPSAVRFAQVAIVEGDEALALRMVNYGVPVVFVSEAPHGDFGRALEGSGLGIAVKPDGLDGAMVRVAQRNTFLRCAKAFATRLGSAMTADDWAKYLGASIRGSGDAAELFQSAG